MVYRRNGKYQIMKCAGKILHIQRSTLKAFIRLTFNVADNHCYKTQLQNLPACWDHVSNFIPPRDKNEGLSYEYGLLPWRHNIPPEDALLSNIVDSHLNDHPLFPTKWLTGKMNEDMGTVRVI